MQYYWFFVLYFWPTVIALRHVHGAIRQARMLVTNFRRWASRRIWEIVIAVVSVWTINNVVEIKTSWHWTIISVKCFIECGLISDVIDGLGHKSRNVMRQEQAVLKNVLCSLYDAAIFAFYDLKFSAVIIAFVAYWLGELIMEIIADECYSFWHRNDVKPTYPLTNQWKMVALLRSSNNDYGAWQFTAVTMCDVDEIDDPLSVLVLEVRRRNRIWRSLILWQVSLLDGQQKKIHEFQLVSTKTIGQPFARGNDIYVQSFQSRGLVIVRSWWRAPPVLFLYDQRSGKSASYKPRQNGGCHFGTILDFACIRRDYNADGSIRGWRARMVDYRNEPCECHPGFGLVRSVLRISTIDFGKKMVLVSQEEIVFGQCSGLLIYNQVFRSTQNLVGVRENRGDDGPIIMFNRVTCVFSRLPNFEALKRIDRPLALYYYTPMPGYPLKMLGDDPYGLFPTFMSEKECVDVYDDGLIVRTEFEPPSMFREALVAMFQATPSLRMMGISADEFRRLTGIEGIGSQF